MKQFKQRNIETEPKTLFAQLLNNLAETFIIVLFQGCQQEFYPIESRGVFTWSDIEHHLHGCRGNPTTIQD